MSSLAIDDLFVPRGGCGLYDLPPPLNGEFESAPDFEDPSFFRNNPAMTSSLAAHDFYNNSLYDDPSSRLFYGRPLARSESRDNPMLPGMVDEFETTVPSQLRIFGRKSAVPQSSLFDERVNVNASDAESVSSEADAGADDDTSDFEVAALKKRKSSASGSKQQRIRGKSSSSATTSSSHGAHKKRKYVESSDDSDESDDSAGTNNNSDEESEDEGGNATPETTDGHRLRRQSNSKSKTSSGVNSSPLFDNHNGQTARKGLGHVLVKKPYPVATAGADRLPGQECFVKVLSKASSSPARGRRVIVSEQVLDEIRSRHVMANKRTPGSTSLVSKNISSAPATTPSRYSSRSRRSSRKYNDDEEYESDNHSEDESNNNNNNNNNESGDEGEEEVEESHRYLINQPNWLEEETNGAKQGDDGYCGPVCAYALCPAPRHSSGMWKTVTPETSAGGQNWKGLIGKTFCHACWTQYRTKGTLSRKHRREINIVDSPEEVKQKFKRARYQQVLQQLQMKDQLH